MSKEEKKQEEIIEVTKNNVEEGEFLEGKNIDEIIREDKEVQRNKNYLAVIILLIGLLAGSLFVDVAQFFSRKGYSARALKDAKIFSLDGKTWVAYKEPIVKMTLLTVNDDELKKCPECKPPKEVTELFKKVIPTLVIDEVDVNSEQGKKIVKKDNIKAVPSLIFSKDVEDTDFYNGEAKVLFKKIDNQDDYKLNVSALGLPTGKYIDTPTIDESNPVIGNRDAKLKIVLFSDHQCPYCAKFFDEIVKVAKGFGDQVVLVYKDFPLDFHSQANNAALAGECAKDQGKFWEMSDILYKTQNQWGKMKDKEAKDFFKKQAVKLKLNPEDFNPCLDEKKHQDNIDKSKKEGVEFGVAGTPALFIGDKFVGGVVPEDKLKSLIQEKLDEINGANQKKKDENRDEKKEQNNNDSSTQQNKQEK